MGFLGRGSSLSPRFLLKNLFQVVHQSELLTPCVLPPYEIPPACRCGGRCGGGRGGSCWRRVGRRRNSFVRGRGPGRRSRERKGYTAEHCRNSFIGCRRLIGGWSLTCFPSLVRAIVSSSSVPPSSSAVSPTARLYGEPSPPHSAPPPARSAHTLSV